jgi:hypothetical protein
MSRRGRPATARPRRAGGPVDSPGATAASRQNRASGDEKQGREVLISDEDFARWQEAAERATAYQSEDGKWAVLRETLEQLDAAEHRSMELYGCYQALRAIVCPNVTDRKWKKLRDESRPIERRIHELRLASATAPRHRGS